MPASWKDVEALKRQVAELSKRLELLEVGHRLDKDQFVNLEKRLGKLESAVKWEAAFTVNPGRMPDTG